MTDYGDRAVWRTDTQYVGVQWTQSSVGFEALELRNRRDGSTRSRPLGDVTVYLGGEADAKCHCCGERFHLEDGVLEWSGNYPTGPCCCSPECREQFDVDAQTLCCDCGEARPTQVFEDGGICTLCASRRIRREVQRLLDIDDCDAVREFARQTGLVPTAPTTPAATSGDDAATAGTTHAA